MLVLDDATRHLGAVPTVSLGLAASALWNLALRFPANTTFKKRLFLNECGRLGRGARNTDLLSCADVGRQSRQ